MKSRKYGLYIHVPFCKSKCYYCDFYSVSDNFQNLIDDYLVSLSEEIFHFLKNNNFQHPQIITLYIGGGTPSILNEKQFINLFSLVKKNFNIEDIKEITVEMNPESINENNLKVLKDIFYMSFNNFRISLGVQSFNEKVLKFLGRVHGVKQIYNAVELFNKLNIKNYNFDLIFGCPEQKIEDVEYDLNNSIKLNPVHISYYALSIEENTVFYKKKYNVDSDLQADMYNLIVKVLEEKKYVQYEISNFAKKGFECLHNINYWLYKEYFGFGPSAVSFFDNKRIKNISNIEEYIRDKFLYNTEKIDKETAIKEKIMLALRTKFGLSLENELVKRYSRIIEKFLKEEKLILENNCLKISDRYKFLSNHIILEFM